jgi:heme/copper-type cytochrome/quinol oxidase subunit 2
LFRNSDHSDLNRWLKRGWGVKDPVRLIKYTNLLNDFNSLGDDLNLIRFRFNDNNQNVVSKDANNVYFSLKQKRYSVRKKFSVKKRFVRNVQSDVSTELADVKKQRLRVLIKNQYFDTITDKDATLSYKYVKKNKVHGENMPVPLARRILRTRRTLVLPAHINLAVITNSYDVVHSWFIPSLGIKLDCVPGRSTHHVIYIDSVGFYYGQCAEICGRYHHHMPIRICALPFEHFLLWWHSYGSPKLLFTKSSRKVNAYYANSKYTW